MTDRELLQQVLDALEDELFNNSTATKNIILAGHAIRARLAQPAQKPLTDEQLMPFIAKAAAYYGYENKPIQTAGFYVFARDVEAAHGIKEK